VKPVLRTVRLLLAFCLCAPVVARGEAPTICDGSTALTLIGIDTTSGSILFSVAPLGPREPRWVVELDAGATAARAYANPPKGLFSGSVGPGPVIAAVPCGKECLQPMRWEGGKWAPLGEPLTAPAASILSTTYDPGGAPWLVFQGAAATEGLAKVWAYRLEGKAWKSRGAMEVTGVGQPASLPAPRRKDAVLAGTGLFSATGPPETWVAGLPDLPAERRGEVVALAGTGAAYVASDGVAYLSDDAGKKWRRSTWTPWDTNGVVGTWRQGSDYTVDLPIGDPQGALRLVWFDRRRPSEEHVVLTELKAGGWVALADVPSEVKTRSGDAMPVTQVLVPKGNDWILLSGCAATAAGSGLVLRVFDGKEASPPRFVPFVMGAGS
jgi:hypothetical protein